MGNNNQQDSFSLQGISFILLVAIIVGIPFHFFRPQQNIVDVQYRDAEQLINSINREWQLQRVEGQTLDLLFWNELDRVNVLNGLLIDGTSETFDIKFDIEPDITQDKANITLYFLEGVDVIATFEMTDWRTSLGILTRADGLLTIDGYDTIEARLTR